jgi:hypothetical protein
LFFLPFLAFLPAMSPPFLVLAAGPTGGSGQAEESVYSTTTIPGHGLNDFLPPWADVLRRVSGGMTDGAAPTGIGSSANSSRVLPEN